MHESTFGDQPAKDDGTQTANPVVHDAETDQLEAPFLVKNGAEPLTALP